MCIIGLDMYLNKSIYVGAKYERRKVAGIIDLTEGDKPVKPIKVDLNKVSEIIEEVAYWRKANHIHNWFIQHCADGDGSIRRVDVSREQLEELVKTCKTALMIMEELPKKKIQVVAGWQGGKEIMQEIEVYDNTEMLQEILPTQDGFFFGSTEYDEWYKQDVENTIKMLEEELTSDSSDYYIYEASW